MNKITNIKLSLLSGSFFIIFGIVGLWSEIQTSLGFSESGVKGLGLIFIATLTLTILGLFCQRAILFKTLKKMNKNERDIVNSNKFFYANYINFSLVVISVMMSHFISNKFGLGIGIIAVITMFMIATIISYKSKYKYFIFTYWNIKNIKTFKIHKDNN